MSSATSTCFLCCFELFPWLQSICRPWEVRVLLDLPQIREILPWSFGAGWLWLTWYQPLVRIRPRSWGHGCHRVGWCGHQDFPINHRPTEEYVKWIQKRVHVEPYGGLNDTAQTFFSNTQEHMSISCGTASVHCDSDGPIGRVFEAGRHRQRRCELPMNLGFSCTSADCSPRHQVGSILRSNRIQKFTASRETKFCDLNEKSASETQPLVNLETPVQIRIIDETLPANSCPGLLEVNTHYDEEVVLGDLSIISQKLSVFNGRFDVVNWAWSVDVKNNEEWERKSPYPTTTSSLSSSPFKMFSAARRPCKTVWAASRVLIKM